MKTLKDFIAETVVEKEPETISQEPEVLETEDYPTLVGENAHLQAMDPPAVLMMRRKSIRQFPNGQRVALYYVDKINKYVTVPYEAMQWGALTPEETVLNNLNAISEDVTKQYLSVYNRLDKQNRKHLVEMAEQDIDKAIDFVQKLLK